MPFILKDFGPAAGTSALPSVPRIHTYRTQDTHATVDTSGYFNQVRSLLSVGDLIYVVVVNGSNVVQTAGWHVVMTKTATAVDVSNVTALTVTNSD
jgi:hypothetical protein